MGAHFGPVFQGDDPVVGGRTYFGSQVSRTARIEPATPPNQVYVSEPFAAALALEKGTDFDCDYVGLTPLAKGYGAFRMYRLRRH